MRGKEASIVTCHLACWSHIFCFSYVPYVYHGWLPHVPTYVVTLFLAGQRDSWASTRSKYQWDSRHCFCAFAGLKLKPMTDSDDFRKAKRGQCCKVTAGHMLHVASSGHFCILWSIGYIEIYRVYSYWYYLITYILFHVCFMSNSVFQQDSHASKIICHQF